MKRKITSLVLGVSLLVGGGGVGLAQDNEAARAAYVRGDYATAFREWSVLAERGDAWAQFKLGVMYEGGQGVIQNYQEAVRWFLLSADQGNAEAQFTLAVGYFTGGLGLRQSDREAAKWYRLSAEKGQELAQFSLGVMYYSGQGVTQDYVYAHMWMNIAASNGDSEAAKFRDIVAGKMTAMQIASAQDLARQCVAKGYKGC